MLIHHRFMRCVFVVALVVLVACGSTPNPRSCLDGTCTSEEFPFCDVDGSFGDTPNTCIAVTCEPMMFAGCRADKELRCNTAGTDYDQIACPLGCQDGVGCRVCEPNETVCANGAVQTCDASGNVTSSEVCPLGCFESEPRCRLLTPSNGLAPYLDMAKAGPVLDQPYLEFNALTGQVRDATNNLDVLVPNFSVANPGGPQMRVFIARRADLRHVEVVSPNASVAFALVAYEAITVTGPLNGGTAGSIVGQECTAGPALYVTDAEVDGAADSSGGGGGGNATAGGRGGSILNYAGGAGGAPVGNDTLVPLRGGCESGGTRNGFTPGATVPGIPGGGAIQLVSATSIVIDGKIDVRGSAGAWDFGPGFNVVTGGGAGGGILLEAPTVDVRDGARLIAKGGPGAASGANFPSPTDTLDPDLGASCIGSTCSSGGRGASVGLAAGDAENVPSTSSADLVAGGGGGGLGRLRINTATGAYSRSSMAVEAALTTVGTVGTR